MRGTSKSAWRSYMEVKGLVRPLKQAGRSADTESHLHPPKHHGRLAIPSPASRPFFSALAGAVVSWSAFADAGTGWTRLLSWRHVSSRPRIRAQTEALGAELAAALKPGDIVLVRGELGAGKTTLVRGAAKALGVSDAVTSPTFSIGHRYRGSEVTVSHLDLYRLAALERRSRSCSTTTSPRSDRIRGVARGARRRVARRTSARDSHPRGRRQATIELCVRDGCDPEPPPTDSSPPERASAVSIRRQ